MTRSKNAPAPSSTAVTEAPAQQASRETVESIVVAVILAFLFRAFVAEAFVIPTGSMAPTLQGRHLDVKCPQCGHRYRTGASMENDGLGRVTRTTCEICRYPLDLDRSPPKTLFLLQGNEDSFNGDRILVSKFAYQLSDPERWDVIVFKYPGNAKQNYIKRLIGLPGESIMIRHGNIHTADKSQRTLPVEERQYRIARKSPSKTKAMLQLVDDTDHISDLLRELGWPSRWQQPSGASAEWEISEDGSEFRIRGDSQDAWLRYRHLVPEYEDWELMAQEGHLPAGIENYRGQLISDYYAYNNFYPHGEPSSTFGSCWVGDLAVEADVRVLEDRGELLLDLVEGGVHYTCRLDLETGKARLLIDGGNGSFVDDAGQVAYERTGQTSVRGPGRYRLRFANVDDQLTLWVNERPVTFDGPATYETDSDVVPVWSPEDPGDLSPVGIGSRDASLEVNRLRVLRDVYYQAVEAGDDYKKSEYDYGHYFANPMRDIREVFKTPESWSDTELFKSRRWVNFDLEEDQFFPLGDNSPQSKDARLWSATGSRERGYDNPPPFVDRDLMIGKALLIYWPHPWRPFLPNFARMGLIR